MAFIKTIRSFDGPYAFLSNFYPAEIQWKGITVPTVEHAYQASKCAFAADALKIARASTPANAKAMARKVIRRDDFDSIKLTIMWQLLCEKFEQPALRDLLVDTGDAKLIEGNHWGDTYWGICDGRGFNHLGQLLMTIRALHAYNTEI